MAEKVIQFWFEELTIDDWSLGPGDMVLSKVRLDHIGHFSIIWIVYLYLLYIYCNIWQPLAWFHMVVVAFVTKRILFSHESISWNKQPGNKATHDYMNPKILDFKSSHSKRLAQWKYRARLSRFRQSHILDDRIRKEFGVGSPSCGRETEGVFSPPLSPGASCPSGWRGIGWMGT